MFNAASHHTWNCRWIRMQSYLCVLHILNRTSFPSVWLVALVGIKQHVENKIFFWILNLYIDWLLKLINHHEWEYFYVLLLDTSGHVEQDTWTGWPAYVIMVSNCWLSKSIMSTRLILKMTRFDPRLTFCTMFYNHKCAFIDM